MKTSNKDVHMRYLLSFCLLLAACSAVEVAATCQVDSECFDGYLCDIRTGNEICRRACTSDSDCLADSQHCESIATSRSVCLPGNVSALPGPDGGDSAGGDSAGGD